MPQIDKYTAGTVTLTNGSTTVTGSSTNWISGGLYSVVAGHVFRYGSFTSLIVAVNSATSITLAQPYSGSTASGLSYEVYRYTRLETPEAVGFLQSLLAKGSSSNPFTRVDIDSGSVRASLRDDGTGQLGWYVSSTGAADGSQVKMATINKTTGNISFTGSVSSPFVAAEYLQVIPAGYATSYKEVADFRVYNNSGRTDYTRMTVALAGTNIMGIEVADAANAKKLLLLQPYGGNVAIGGGNFGVGTNAPGGLLHVALTTTPAWGSNWGSWSAVVGGSTAAGGGLGFSYNDTNGAEIGAVVPGTAWKPVTIRGAGVVFKGDGVTEHARISTVGFLGIGTNAPLAPLEIKWAPTGPLIKINAADATSAKAVIEFQRSGVSRWTIGPDIAGTGDQSFFLYDNVANAVAWLIDASRNFYPGADNSQSLGLGSQRWSVLYAGTGTINTSDAREKVTLDGADITEETGWAVTPLTDAELAAARELAAGIGWYKWKDAVAKKGDAARQHVGLTAQFVLATMEKHGLDAWACGLMCRDQITRKVKKTEKRMVPKVEEVEVAYTEIEVRDGVPVQVAKTRIEKRPVTEKAVVLDEKGNPVLRVVQATEDKVETYTDIEMRDGKAVQVEKKRTVKVPLFDTVQVVNAKGKAVLEEVEVQKGVDDEGKPILNREKRPKTAQVPIMTTEPEMHDVPVMVEQEVEIEVDEPAGYRDGLRPGQVDEFMLRGLAEKVAMLEAK